MRNLLKVLIVLCAGALITVTGCSKKPSQEELTRLQESKAAAEAAEKKLSDLREERKNLEATLEGKKQELQKLEAERDKLNTRLGK